MSHSIMNMTIAGTTQSVGIKIMEINLNKTPNICFRDLHTSIHITDDRHTLILWIQFSYFKAFPNAKFQRGDAFPIF